jgi:hypothetical protein
MTNDPGLTPGFVHITDRRPIESFYETPADSSAPHVCCLRDVVVSRHEFKVITWCPVHGQKECGNVD